MQRQGSCGETFGVVSSCFLSSADEKAEANRCLSVLMGRRKESGLFEAQGAAESGQTQATWGYQRTFPIYSSHTENNKPVSVKATLCEENTELLGDFVKVSLRQS